MVQKPVVTVRHNGVVIHDKVTLPEKGNGGRPTPQGGPVFFQRTAARFATATSGSWRNSRGVMPTCATLDVVAHSGDRRKGRSMLAESFPFRGLFDRRMLVRAGAVGAVGLSLPQLLAAERKPPRGPPPILHPRVCLGRPSSSGYLRSQARRPRFAALRHDGYQCSGMRLVDQFPRLA